MTEFLYYARLAPLDETLIVSGKHGRTLEHFDSSIFALEREQPERVAVLLDHDERRMSATSTPCSTATAGSSEPSA